MEDQDRPDNEFLKELERRYAGELVRLERSMQMRLQQGSTPEFNEYGEITQSGHRWPPMASLPNVPVATTIPTADSSARSDREPSWTERDLVRTTLVIGILAIIVGLFALFSPFLRIVFIIVDTMLI